MIAALGRRVPLIPDVGSARLAERALAIGAAGLHDQGQLVDRRRSVPGVADEPRVLGVGDRLNAQEEVVQVDPVGGTFVLFRILGAHEEFAGGDQREFGREVARHVSAPRG